MVNTVAVEKLEDFIQKWAEKVIEEETADQPEESKHDEVENGDTKEEDGKENAGEEDENNAGKQGMRMVFRDFFVLTLSFYFFSILVIIELTIFVMVT